MEMRRVSGGIIMEAIRYLSAFRLYGADVLLLALSVTLATSLLKKTVLKNMSRKVFVFLPYLLGLVIYCVYRMITTLSAIPITKEFFATAEGGFAVGCAATLYYVVYEQFFRKEKKDVNILTPLFEGIVPDEEIGEITNYLIETCADKTQAETEEIVKETLARYPSVQSNAEIEVFAKLVTEYLSALNQK